MNRHGAFAVTVLAAAFWFILNPDFKSRTASADRIVFVPAPTEVSSLIKREASRGIASVSAAGFGGPVGGGSAPKEAARVLYENILVQVGPNDDGGCYANIVEAPVLVGTSLPPIEIDCSQITNIRGSAIYDPSKSLFTDFEPNTVAGDRPYDRKVIARWKDYGALCPNGVCTANELVYLEDGAIRVKGTADGPGKLSGSDVKYLLSTYLKVASTAQVERRIDDPRTSDTVEIQLIPK